IHIGRLSLLRGHGGVRYANFSIAQDEKRFLKSALYELERPIFTERPSNKANTHHGVTESRRKSTSKSLPQRSRRKDGGHRENYLVKLKKKERLSSALLWTPLSKFSRRRNAGMS